jgi:hypothetical protein
MLAGIILAAVASQAAAAGPAGLSVAVGKDLGAELSINGKPWFSSNTTGVFTHGRMQTIENQGLTVQSSAVTQGTDAYGDFVRTAVQLKIVASGEAMETAIRDYTASRDVVIFEQVSLFANRGWAGLSCLVLVLWLPGSSIRLSAVAFCWCHRCFWTA